MPACPYSIFFSAPLTIINASKLAIRACFFKFHRCFFFCLLPAFRTPFSPWATVKRAAANNTNPFADRIFALLFYAFGAKYGIWCSVEFCPANRTFSFCSPHINNTDSLWQAPRSRRIFLDALLRTHQKTLDRYMG